jgi:hypothetical protein
MDWPVVGSLAGVTVLAGVVGVGAYAVLSSGPSSVNSPATPSLLALGPSRPAPNIEPRPDPRVALSVSSPRLTVQDADHTAAVRPALPIRLAPRLRLEQTLPSGRLTAPGPKPLAAPRPDKESLEPRRPPIVAKPTPPKEPDLDPYDGRVMTAKTIGRVRATLRLMPAQMAHWNPVEAILHEIGREQIAQIKRGGKPEVGTGVMMRLYYSAQPLIGTLQPDQKERVRALARSLGYGQLASML